MSQNNIDTRHPVFCRMQEDFTEGVNDALKRMLRNGVNDGRVVCTLEIKLIEDEVEGTHGIARMVKTPIFVHKIKTSVSQGISINAATKMQGTEILIDHDGFPEFSEYARQMTIFDQEGQGDEEE